MNNEQPRAPRARKDGLIVRESQGEVLVYDLQRNKAHCLNDSAARIWNACDGQRTAAGISEQVSSDLGTRVDEKAVWFALANLQKSDLLEEDVVPAELLRQAGRRDAVRRLGFATLIAIPTIASIVTPASDAHASEHQMP